MTRHNALAAAVSALTLMLAVPALAQPAPAVVEATSSYSELVIADGALPVASNGRSLTLTVDGVETRLAPGTFRGDVVLSVTDPVPVQFTTLPVHQFRSALHIVDGRPASATSVGAAISGGMVDQRRADGLRIVSRGENFNAVLAEGTGAYTLEAPVIDLTGNGGNDFAGFGAAIMASGQATLTVNRPIIRTHGAVRPALFIGGDATLVINDGEIAVRNGTLPDDYQFTVEVGKMFQVPWMLGLSGNVRAVNLVGDGTLYINRSHITSQGWGALSTDMADHTRMYVTDSLVEAIEAGYGTYSIGDSHNHFARSVIRAADIGGIIAGEASLTFTDHTSVSAGLYGVMMHSGQGGGTLTINDDSSLTAGRAAIEVKGRGTTILIEDAHVTSGNGIILQAMENDDPFMKAMLAGEVPPGMGGPPPGTEAMLPGAGAQFSPDVVAVFRRVTLVGDVWNGRTREGALDLSLASASLTGVISTSTTAPASGAEPVEATYREIGNVTNTAASGGEHGLSLTLDGASHWTVTGTSFLTALTLAPGAVVDGAGGRQVELRVDGRVRPLRAGAYAGAIQLSLR